MVHSRAKDYEKFDPGVSLSDWTLKHIRKHAKTDKIAQTCGHSGEAMSYHDLLRDSVRFAKGIQSMGVKVGETVALFARNYHEVFVATLGCVFSGVTVAPSVPTSSPAELAHHLTLVAPRFVLVEEELVDIVNEAVEQAEGVLPQRPFVMTLQSDEFRSIIERGEDADPDTFKASPIKDRADHVAFVLYSSGTTGLSKGVMISNTGLTLQMEHFRDTLLDLREVLLCSSPLSWITALLMLFSGIKHGVNRVFVRESETTFLLDVIEKHKVQSWIAAPAILLGMTDFVETNPDRYDTSRLTKIVVGGATMAAETQERISRVIGAKVQQAYGCTETGIITFGDLPNVKMGSVGREAPFVHLQVIDPETERVLTEHGQVGEFRLKPVQMKGYVGNPEETAKAFDSEDRYKTGDLGYIDEDGDAYVVDRIKEMIKFRGYQIAPAEVEGLLLQSPDIADVCVLGRSHPEHGDLPTAVVVRSPGSTITADEVKAIVANTLSDAKNLRGGVIFVDSIPRTTTGKNLRRKLKEMIEEMNFDE